MYIVAHVDENMILHLEWCHLICYVFCAKNISARTQLRWVKNCNLSCMKQNCARVAWAGMGYKLQPELCETELCLDSGWAELGCVINCRQAGCLPATHHASCLADLFSGKTLSALHSLDDHPHSSHLFSSLLILTHLISSHLTTRISISPVHAQSQSYLMPV